MADDIHRFEQIARIAHRFSTRQAGEEAQLHPFDQRDIYSGLPSKVRQLFDDGHFPQATFEAFKFLDKWVQKNSGSRESGRKLMMAVFDSARPGLRLNPLTTESEVDEQEGFRFIFSGAVMAIRNPRGHEIAVADDLSTCLDHLAFASMLIRRLESAGYTKKP
ncbi:MAG TPA: TIGR02391 family protein [Steroidobacteraceae bacterium]|nr:TIGR02391 family protein [Steroidobacteraceae bacterium]